MTRRRPPSVEDLVARGVDLVRDYANVETSKTAILKQLAEVVVDLRQRFHDDDGRVDWAGRTYIYRETVARIYHEASVPPDSLDGMQSALRYHVGNLLRAVAPPEDLEDLGLKSKRPVERVKAVRERQAALARAGAALERTGGKRKADPVSLIVSAEVTLSKTDEEALASLDPAVVEDLVASLEAIADRALTLLRVLEPIRTRRRGGRRRLEAV